jgi:hypothetical protein
MSSEGEIVVRAGENGENVKGKGRDRKDKEGMESKRIQ